MAVGQTKKFAMTGYTSLLKVIETAGEAGPELQRLSDVTKFGKTLMQENTYRRKEKNGT